MAAIIPNEGERDLLQLIKDGSMHRIVLFKSNTTPGDSTTWSMITECDFSGYARATPTWGAVATGGDGRAFMEASPITFTHNGGATANDVYGWALINGDPGNEIIRMIERLSSPPEALNSNGDQLTVTPRMYLRQQGG